MTKAKITILLLAVTLFAAAGLSGCGQKGDLYLPDRWQDQSVTASGH
ncbi:MAG: lipoprotein [Gammaproteobacteria bacterium]|nr:lipoprotein [Gammaproteobacteria bacterium]